MKEQFSTGMITSFNEHIKLKEIFLIVKFLIININDYRNTAYFGLKEICQPKAGETLVVSGAGGAVGSHVGQIGKILGLNIIGITGSDKKCKWLKEELGFDHAINYKTQDIASALSEAAPNKVDCYYDNVCINLINMFRKKSK